MIPHLFLITNQDDTDQLLLAAVASDSILCYLSTCDGHGALPGAVSLEMPTFFFFSLLPLSSAIFILASLVGVSQDGHMLRPLTNDQESVKTHPAWYSKLLSEERTMVSSAAHPGDGS